MATPTSIQLAQGKPFKWLHNSYRLKRCGPLRQFDFLAFWRGQQRGCRPPKDAHRNTVSTCTTVYCSPMPVSWWPIMVALALAMALSGLFFLSLILFPVQAHWMLAMALSGFFS